MISGRGSEGVKGLFQSGLNLLRRLKTPQRRSELLTALRFRDGLFQAATYTVADRYPALFAACASLLQPVAAPLLLSFGCSTGEEAVSLLRWIPAARILGVDINPWCVREASRRCAGGPIRFAHVDSAEYSQATGFNAIFCMAVFQHAENRTRQATQVQGALTFQRFEQELQALDKRLLPGGLLFLDNADFLFTDTSVSAGYDAVVFRGSSKTRDRPVFNRGNLRVAEESTVERCFRKRT